MLKKLTSLLLVLCMIVCMVPASAFAAGSTISGTFTYGSFLNPGKEAELDFTYSDSWFSNTGYQHDLAKMTLRMAIAGANGQSDYIEALFDKLGFTYTESSVNYCTPSADSIGYAIASRKTADNGTIIAVVIRGNEYDKEWASNFTVGTGSEHKGFGDSADIVANAVKQYIQSLGVTENIKLWTTGYSRAAAVANILGQRFNTWAETGAVKGVSKNGIYAYTYESPRTVKISAAGNYTNIYNITNYNDVVTKVVPAAWGFGRYGITYFLPCSELSADYSSYVSAANKKLTAIGASSTMPLADDAASYTDIVIDRLSAFIGSQSKYVSSFEDILRANISTLNVKLTAQNFTTAFSTVATDMITDFATSNLTLVSRLLSGDGAMKIISYHYPEYCLALLDSTNSASDFANSTTRHISVGGSVNLTVYDENGKVAGYTENGKYVNVSSSSVTGYISDKSQKVVILPYDGEYTVELKAIRSGNINCTVEEYNAYDESIKCSAIYKGVAVTSGDVLTVKFENRTKTSNPQYDLIGSSGEAITAASKTGIKSSSSETVPDIELPFTDIKSGDKYYDDVVYAYANKLMSGTSATEFSADMTITRGMIVTILYRLEGEPAVSGTSTFTDVKSGKYYANAVAWASANNIVAGMGDGTFAPENTITREQMAAIIFRYAKFKNSSYENEETKALAFADNSDIHSWGEQSIRWCVDNGIMTARTGSSFMPNASATRGESAFALHYLCLVLGK